MPTIVAKLEITVDEDGRIDVQGPIANRLLCFGLLDIAHESIQEAFIASQRHIVPATELERVALARD